jgi:hypothetical protein
VPYSVEREDPSPAEAIIITRQKQNEKKDLVALQFLREILIPPIIHQSSSSPGTCVSSLISSVSSVVGEILFCLVYNRAVADPLL